MTTEEELMTAEAARYNVRPSYADGQGGGTLSKRETHDSQGRPRLWKPPATAAVAASMAANQSGRTGPELLLQAAMRLEGEPGFVERDRNLPGSPDLAYWTERVAVFMHGCYWHSCPDCYPGGAYGRMIGGANRELWLYKFARTQERDVLHTVALADLGWEAVALWECMVNEALLECTQVVKLTLERRRLGL